MEFSLNSSRQTRYMWLTCISELAINVDQQRVVSFGYPSDKVVKSEIKQLLASPLESRISCSFAFIRECSLQMLFANWVDTMWPIKHSRNCPSMQFLSAEDRSTLPLFSPAFKYKKSQPLLKLVPQSDAKDKLGA